LRASATCTTGSASFDVSTFVGDPLVFAEASSSSRAYGLVGIPCRAFVLDARPLAWGAANQIGLTVGGVADGTSTGPGSGGGVGTGRGTGLGSGRGPGVGPGSGGGFGGGAYREGGAIASPRLLVQVRPNYTSEALERRIQGEVWLMWW
jgi:hypothetical protein